VRRVEWQESRVETEHGTVVDYIGMLGPLKAFTLAQASSPRGGWANEWTMTSHFIPSRQRGKTYRNPDDGKRACEDVVAGFARWLTE
jgi:hypothetical protein